MKKLYAIFFCCIGLMQAKGQLPVQITVPPVCTDKNQQFGIMSFDVSADAEKFTILYYQVLNASVATDKEFLPDKGGYAYEKPKRENPIPNSDQVLLLVRQTIQKNGDANTDQIWVLAKRKMESADEYKLYFKSSFTHPIIKSEVPIKLTVHNLDNVEGLTDKERVALTLFVKKEFMPEGYTYTSSRPSTLADDLNKMKEDLKSLKATGFWMRGNLPKTEDIITRFEIVSKKKFVVTRQKSDTNQILRFYLTEAYKDFQLVDSIIVKGDMILTYVCAVYNKSAQPVGAYTNFVHKYKDTANNEQSEIISVFVDDNDDLSHWTHIVGKNKPSSLKPEVCWMDGKKLIVLSSNSEKVFKPYYMVQQFEKGKDVAVLYPQTEEEKKSEKFQFVKTFQANMPMDMTMAEKFIPMSFMYFDNTLYIMGHGFAVDQTKHVNKYLAPTIYRIKDNKLTDIEVLKDYVGENPVAVDPLIENTNKEVLMLGYQAKIQLVMDKDQIVVSPIETATNRLVPNEDGTFISGNNNGVTMLSKTTMGTKYTLFFYPKK